MESSGPTSPTGLNFGVFREPRGVMRILQFVFSICAFATTSGFVNKVTLTLNCITPKIVTIDFSYPFRLDHISQDITCQVNDSTSSIVTHQIFLQGDFSSDSQFFVATGVLAFLYCLGIIVIYVMYDSMYQKNELLPLIDFVITVILAVFWLSGSAAWANGLTGMKNMTPHFKCEEICTDVHVGSFSGLDISVILGFLNFFLWASDLWFLYKETSWFKARQPSSGIGAA